MNRHRNSSRTRRDRLPAVRILRCMRGTLHRSRPRWISPLAADSDPAGEACSAVNSGTSAAKAAQNASQKAQGPGIKPAGSAGDAGAPSSGTQGQLHTWRGLGGTGPGASLTAMPVVAGHGSGASSCRGRGSQWAESPSKRGTWWPRAPAESQWASRVQSAPEGATPPPGRKVKSRVCRGGSWQRMGRLPRRLKHDLRSNSQGPGTRDTRSRPVMLRHSVKQIGG